MIDSLIESYSLIFEDSNSIPGDIRGQLKGASKLTPVNRFRSKIQGFVIEDSVNNVTFPMDYPILDTSKIMLGEIYKRFRNFYADGQNILLPWHFVVEFYGHDYVVHATRPMTHRFPINKKDSLRLMKSRDQEFMDKDTELFMTKQDNLDAQEMIHILIVGDSSMDVYTRDIYSKIGSLIISPLARTDKISPQGKIFPLNMGRKFNVAAVLPAASLA